MAYRLASFGDEAHFQKVFCCVLFSQAKTLWNSTTNNIFGGREGGDKAREEDDNLRHLKIDVGTAEEEKKKNCVAAFNLYGEKIMGKGHQVHSCP